MLVSSACLLARPAGGLILFLLLDSKSWMAVVQVPPLLTFSARSSACLIGSVYSRVDHFAWQRMSGWIEAVRGGHRHRKCACILVCAAIVTALRDSHQLGSAMADHVGQEHAEIATEPRNKRR